MHSMSDRPHIVETTEVGDGQLMVLDFLSTSELEDRRKRYLTDAQILLMDQLERLRLAFFEDQAAHISARGLVVLMNERTRLARILKREAASSTTAQSIA